MATTVFDRPTNFNDATQSASGLMSASDKTKLDGVATGATANTGTVTKVSTGAGLTGGDITTTGTVSISGMDTSSGSTSKCLTEKGTWASFSNNAGTVTKVSTGAGLTGGDITTTGTISINGMNTSSGSTSKCLTEKGTWASFTNNSGTITGITMNGSSKGTSGVVDLGTVITAHQDISGKVDKTETQITNFNDATTTGLYYFSAATNAPTSTDAGNAIILNNGNGIVTQIATISNRIFIRRRLSGTWNAWSEKTSNVGTITGITMNGASKGTSGVVDLGTVITAHQDISGKLNGKMVAINSSYTFANLKAESASTQPIFFTNWTDTTNFPTIYGSGAKLYAADSSSDVLYYINYQGKMWIRYIYEPSSVDTGWKEIITSGNIGSQSVSYATSAGSATDSTARSLGTSSETTFGTTAYTASASVEGNKIIKQGKHVHGQITYTASINLPAGTALMTIPSGYRPTANTQVPAMLKGSDDKWNAYYAFVNSNGNVGQDWSNSCRGVMISADWLTA